MSDLLKSVSPALKLMKVLTTATDASEIPTAAGMPSSRTSPEAWRVNSPPSELAAPGGRGAVIPIPSPPKETLTGTFHRNLPSLLGRIKPARGTCSAAAEPGKS